MVGKKKKIIFSLVGLLLLLVAVPAGIFLVSQSQELRKSAAPATTLFFTPAALEKERGEEFMLSLEIDTGENAPSAADVTVLYDPAVLEFKSLTQGSFFSQSVPSSETISPGLIRFVYYESETVGPEAEGILASLGFMVKTDAAFGATEVVIDKTKSKVAATDPTFTDGTIGNVLDTVRSSVITVAEGGAVPVTPTPTTAAGATPTATATPVPGATATPTVGLSNCWQTCTADGDCSGELVCESVNGTYRCVNLDCVTESDCVCTGAAATTTPTATRTPTPTGPTGTTVPGATATPTATRTPTPTATATLVPGATATPTTAASSAGTTTATGTTATPSPAAPVSGFTGPTALLSIGAAVLLILGWLALAI